MGGTDDSREHEPARRLAPRLVSLGRRRALPRAAARPCRRNDQFRRHRRRRSGRRLVEVHKAASGYDVNLVAIGNAPSAILNMLVAGGGTARYDIINIVGGMQKPLVDNNLVEVIDTSRLPNWAKDSNIEEFLGKGKPGFKFIGYRTSSTACRPCCRATRSPICRRRPARSTPMPRCSIRNGKAMSRSRTITPPPARRRRSI